MLIWKGDAGIIDTEGPCVHVERKLNIFHAYVHEIILSMKCQTPSYTYWVLQVC